MYPAAEAGKHGKLYTLGMYGVNGAMSVLASVRAIIVSMLFGFTSAFFLGLSFYLIIPLVLYYTKFHL